ncbi:AraC family transcriptional regulator [Pararhizobium antarcticum]|uniref:AraC family transcriptional regulator n=1 Tax=Pararhizobium antarcticum TaxID=1798805 RepID=A0A657LVL0_9HYPH|nr:AraC family transcriptional regulator [Pararhizobium antarcticum]OJF95688.1 AraC family transcriptional regulator [Rhizobium sp. 58]OJF99436.1 AraC family transcriptional regulator [Pararhizobium antarcticum]
MSSVSAIRASVLIPIIAHMEKTGLQTDALLARHGIMRSQIANPYAMVPLTAYVSFFEEASRMSNSTNLGALLGTTVTPGDLGPTGVLFNISPTILDAMRRVTRYISAIQGATSNGLWQEGDDYVWSYQISSSKLWPRRQDSEFTLSVCCQLIRLGFSRTWRPQEVHFEHPAPRDTTILEKIFRAPLKFAQPSNRLIMAGPEAERSYRSEDPALVAVLEHHIAELAEKTNATESMRERVSTLISIHLGYRKITIAGMAADLGMAPRTLQRRLQEENTSLRDMVERHRRELAQKQLTGNVDKGRISESLGYADSTVFWRARQRWGRHDG